ncbi:MAG TPA: glyoxalase superfamily protein [Actinomycetota bacterium]|nr:glyoxalase superfamily protein [Actinomycetota bacterium]
MDWRIELVVLPVTDVDRAKAFYSDQLGFRVDVDHRAGDSFRVVQLTPPGSPCSISIGTGITDAAPGSVRGLHIVVPDIQAAVAQLAAAGVEVGPIRHMGPNGWVDGPHPDRADYNSFAFFADPDGNTWAVQEVGHRRVPAGPEAHP